MIIIICHQNSISIRNNISERRIAMAGVVIGRRADADIRYNGRHAAWRMEEPSRFLLPISSRQNRRVDFYCRFLPAKLTSRQIFRATFPASRAQNENGSNGFYAALASPSLFATIRPASACMIHALCHRRAHSHYMHINSIIN